MKKAYLLFTLISVFLLTGCTKKYDTIEDYEVALKNVRKQIPSYTIEAKQNFPFTEMYYRTFMKGDKWKTEVSMNGGISYNQTILYDGNDLLIYTPGSPFAVTNPILEYLNDESEDIKKETIKKQNQLNAVFDWTESQSLIPSFEKINATFVDNKANKNGFDCRLISFSDNREACVSDKYGIAVYLKSQYENFKTKEIEETQINVIKIDTTNLSDSTFELPAGIKKQTLDNVLDMIESFTK